VNSVKQNPFKPAPPLVTEAEFTPFRSALGVGGRSGDPNACSDAVELEEIKSALATVLPGPWKYDHDGGVVWASEAVKPTADSNAISRVCDATGRWALHDPTHEAKIVANLKFIAKCREWIPALVAEVERLRHQNAALSEPGGGQPKT